jgi:hypothetical protein
MTVPVHEAMYQVFSDRSKPASKPRAMDDTRAYNYQLKTVAIKYHTGPKNSNEPFCF